MHEKTFVIFIQCIVLFSFLGETSVEVEAGENDVADEQETKEEPLDVFYPTDQWQTVKKGKML